MANMTFKANLLPNSTSGEYSLGSSTNKWAVKGTLNGARIFYGVCDTATATTAKTVNCDDFTADDLVVGATVIVNMKNTNSGAKGSLTLSVNGTTAKPIRYQYNASTSAIPDVQYLMANKNYIFCYDGTNWVVTNMHYNSNTTYSKMTVEEMQGGTATTGRTIAAVDLANNYLQLTGGTMTGAIYTKGLIGTQNIDYGPTLPASAAPGQLFFQTSNTVVYSVPAGGTVGYALIKNSNENGDFSWQEIELDDYLPLSGGTMIGAIYTHGLVGTQNIDYGPTLPTSAIPGQLFFQTGGTVVYSVPAGGGAGQALVKNTNADGDFSWQQIQTELETMSAAEIKGGTVTTARTMRADYIKTALSGLGGTGLTFTHNSTSGIVLNHTNSATTKSAYVDSATTANAAGGTIKVTDVKYDGQGHITTTQDRTITLGLVQGYGDTTSPYASKTKGYVLAAPSSANGVPSFRQLGLTELSGADDVKAIEALSGTSGFLKKTAANTWTLDTGSYSTTDTKNTAGSTQSDSKLFLVGATSQAANPQTYSNTAIYGTAGVMAATSFKIAEAVTLQYNSTTQALDFVFA